LDIDGTIVRSSGEISPAVIEAVHALTDQNVKVVLATGRSMVATVPVFESLGVSGYAVCSNGAITAEVTLGSSSQVRIIDMVAFRPGAALNALIKMVPDVYVAVEGNWLGFRVNKQFPTGDLMGPHEIVPWAELTSVDAIRVTIRDQNSAAQQLMHLLEAIGIGRAAYDILGRGWVDIIPPNVSKASALERIRQMLDVPGNHTYACGDQSNDLEMLRWSAHSVAMGHSPVELQAVATHVAGPIDNDGVLELLRPMLYRH
jgi:HAD superfamily hydrolase (TIGR01484 family)